MVCGRPLVCCARNGRVNYYHHYINLIDVYRREERPTSEDLEMGG